MQVGVNHPWLNYGWDFGLGPPAWRGRQTTPVWYGEIARHLQHFHDLGIHVVRWFILADGLTYGSGNDAPQLQSGSGAWRFDPPPLGADILEHFNELLQRFAAFNAGRQNPVRLLPVLIDFHFCDAGAPDERGAFSLRSIGFTSGLRLGCSEMPGDGTFCHANNQNSSIH